MITVDIIISGNRGEGKSILRKDLENFLADKAFYVETRELSKDGEIIYENKRFSVAERWATINVINK